MNKYVNYARDKINAKAVLSVRKMSISISDLLKIPIIDFFDLDQNGRFVVYSSNETGIPHLYVLPTELGSKPKQLTSGKDPVMIGMISPRGDKLVYLQDKDGNEIHHLFLLPVEDREAKRITVNPYRTGGVDWHPSGKEVTRTFVSMKLCGLETCNVETGECFMLKESALPFMDLQYSHDGKWIACTMALNFKKTQVLIVSRDDPTDTIAYSVKDDSKEVFPSWSPNDKKLAFISDAKGRPQIVIQEFQGEERTFLGLEEDEEVAQDERVIWSPKGNKVYYVVSKYSQTTVHGHPIDGGKEAALPFPKGTVTSPKVSKDGKIIGALHSSINSPPRIYLHKVGSKSASSLTSRNYKVDLTRLAKPKSVWYESFDGRKIHGWYVPAASGTKPHPAVIYAHGGPWWQVFDKWFLYGVRLQSLSLNGFAVFAPNFRGSTGYGAEFRDLDIGDPGGGDLEDVVYGAEWLRKQPAVDSSKIAIMGGSYGGYMTLMALTKKPEVFSAGVSITPVVDWLEMYELSDLAFRSFIERLLEGPPSKKEKLYRDRSPITHAPNTKAPVMIMAGKQDSRCPVQPIEKFVKKLEEMNNPHELVIEEKAGHESAFSKWEESIPIFTGIVNYLKKILA